MLNLFGSSYEELGSSNANLVLKTLGKIKIQIGQKFLDLINSDGKLVTESLQEQIDDLASRLDAIQNQIK